MTDFGTKSVVQLTGATERKLQWWDERKILYPMRVGHRRRWPPVEIALADLIVKLRPQKLSLHRLRQVLEATRQAIHSRKCRDQALTVVICGTSVLVSSRAEQVLEFLRLHSGPAWVVEVKVP